MSNKQRRKKLRRKKVRRQERLEESLKGPTYGPIRPMTEADYARVHARFGCLVGRGVTLRFHVMGPRVQASNPEELKEAWTRALIEETEQQDPS